MNSSQMRRVEVVDDTVVVPINKLVYRVSEFGVWVFIGLVDKVWLLQCEAGQLYCVCGRTSSAEQDS